MHRAMALVLPPKTNHKMAAGQLLHRTLNAMGVKVALRKRVNATGETALLRVGAKAQAGHLVETSHAAAAQIPLLLTDDQVRDLMAADPAGGRPTFCCQLQFLFSATIMAMTAVLAAQVVAWAFRFTRCTPTLTLR